MSNICLCSSGRSMLLQLAWHLMLQMARGIGTCAHLRIPPKVIKKRTRWYIRKRLASELVRNLQLLPPSQVRFSWYITQTSSFMSKLLEMDHDMNSKWIQNMERKYKKLFLDSPDFLQFAALFNWLLFHCYNCLTIKVHNDELEEHAQNLADGVPGTFCSCETL